jgi:hypothetical protein
MTQVVFTLWVVLAGTYFIAMLAIMYGVPNYKASFAGFDKILYLILLINPISAVITLAVPLYKQREVDRQMLSHPLEDISGVANATAVSTVTIAMASSPSALAAPSPLAAGSSNASPRLAPKERLAMCTRDPEVLAALREFSTRALAVENLEFLLAVDVFKAGVAHVQVCIVAPFHAPRQDRI